MVGRVAGARVEQVRVAPAIDFEETLVVARGTDRFTVLQHDRGEGAGLAWMLDADPPFPAFLAAQGHDVAANVDQRIADAHVAQDIGSPVERHTFQVTAEIEGDVAVAATDGSAVDGDVGDRRLADAASP